MSTIGKLIADLIEAGTPPLLVGAVAELYASMDHRSAGAQRQEGYRRRLDVPISEWVRLREEVFIRDGYQCVYCQKDVMSRPQCDHVTPLIDGGKTALENLATACKGCNSSKAGRALKDWARA